MNTSIKPPAPELDRVELFFGDANAAEARLYARLEWNEDLAGRTLAGSVVGPKNDYCRTLPATIPLIEKPSADGNPNDSLLAEAILPDPCFWTPSAPHLYEVHVRLEGGPGPVLAITHSLGIRPLGVRGRRLLLDGEAWALRAVDQNGLPGDTPIDDWHTAATSMLVQDPDEPLSQEATRRGVLLVALLSTVGEQPIETVRRLNRWASVGIIVLDANVPGDTAMAARRHARNLLFAVRVGAANTAPLPAWADIVFCPAEPIDQAARWAAECPLPVVAFRSAQRHESLVAARAACDRLQRDLAGSGDFAGYVV